jgi:hypothetical protein
LAQIGVLSLGSDCHELQGSPWKHGLFFHFGAIYRSWPKPVRFLLSRRSISVMVNLRDASQVAIETPALQRLLDLINFEATKPQVTLSCLIIPQRNTDIGVRILSISYAWIDIVEKLQGY